MHDKFSVFAPTADQRFLLGEDLFLQTHFPMSARRYLSNGQPSLVSEGDLLTSLRDGAQVGPGNRLWVLYGAPGSGKSELIKWLETRLKHESPERHAITVRVSSNELDVLSLLKRFLGLLPDRFLEQTITSRWQLARQKPRTVTKIILLFALESMVESDDHINALYYRLVNAVHPYVERILRNERVNQVDIQSVELIGQETWEAIVTETAIDMPLEFEQFRHQLTSAFQNHLLDGLSVSNVMQQISDYLRGVHGQRPILLVDDLVQSLNVFATDILDYLLTLELGNWDVVVGVTPAAFEDNLRGRALLQRIAYLDTIDDRLEKLWLSDETGQESYVITEENCGAFAMKYLTADPVSTSVPFDVLPLTNELFVRLFRGLPKGKGKARYFIRHLREVLVRVELGEDPLAILGEYAVTEYVARTSDERLARACEFYGPLLVENGVKEVLLPTDIRWALNLPDGSCPIEIEPVVRFLETREMPALMIADEKIGAVRDWLLGRPVNRQLLKPLRQAIARWLRVFGVPVAIHRPHIARPAGVLRWEQAYLGVKPPVFFEGIDDSVDIPGVQVGREIGAIAFDLCHYGAATGVEARALAGRLAERSELVPLVEQGDALHRRLVTDLTRQLGMTVEQLSFGLFVFHSCLRSPDLSLPGLPPGFTQALDRLRTHRSVWLSEIDSSVQDTLQQLFLDFFRLRESVLDGPAIARVVDNHAPDDVLVRLLTIDTTCISSSVRLAGRPLQHVLADVQGIVVEWLGLRTDQHPLSIEATHLLSELRSETSQGVRYERYPSTAWHELAQSDAHNGQLWVVWRERP